MNISKVLTWAVGQLPQLSNSAQLDSELLLLHSINNSERIYSRSEPIGGRQEYQIALRQAQSDNKKKDRLYLVSHANDTICSEIFNTFKQYISRRKKGEPVAYITNHKEFFGLDFFIDNRVLIPRPETELLVENTLKKINQRPHVKSQISSVIIDIGTGSGCIPISILKSIHSPNTLSSRRQEESIMPITYAVDISTHALEVAKINVQNHAIDKYITLLQGNLLKPFGNITIPQYNNIIITANLPYLTETEYNEYKAKLCFEPKKALVAKNNGLEFIDQLIQQTALLVKQFSPKTLTIILEHHPHQTKSIHNLIMKHAPEFSCQTKKDLADLDRITTIQFNNTVL